MFFSQLFIGCLMIGLTVVVHAVMLDRLVILIEKVSPFSYRIFKKTWHVPLMVLTVLGVFLAHIIEIWIWALVLLSLEPNILPDLETALYFSTSSFTTVGYGDIYLDKDWRLLSAFESANGFMLFGWSTAFIFEIINKIYKDEKIKKH